MVKEANPPGSVVTVWQVSQGAELVGTWLTAVSAIGVTFWNAVPLWQVAQPELMPVWLMAPVTNPPGTVVLLWQTEQSCVVAMWFVPLETGVTFWNALPLWQVAQPELMPVWLIVPVTNPPGIVVLLWQTEQSCVVVKWFEPFETGVTP